MGTAELEALLVEMLGAGVSIAVGAPGDAPLGSLHPEEAHAVHRAVEKRRLEMAAGRALARSALEAFDLGHVTIARSESGAPVWPPGIVGSITHTAAVCAAAVARRETLRALGIDAEPEGALEPELWPELTTANELDALRELPPGEAGARARWIFCAKEAAYKCQYPLTGLLLDFGDLEIRWCPAAPGFLVARRAARSIVRFDAIYQRDAAPFRNGDAIPGLLGRAEGHLVAVARLRVTGRNERE